MSNELNEKSKFEILEREYSLLFEEINTGYNTIQSRVSILSATYAFIFTGFITAISQWQDFRSLPSLVLIESFLLILAFAILLPAMFITKFKKWKSFGNPKETIAKLKKSNTYEAYYSLKVEEWADIAKNNKDINSITNLFLIANFIALMFVISVILFHIILVLIC